jgi:predicted transcriptional regulator
MTIRLDRETRRGLDRLARATTRSKAYLAQEAIRNYLAQNAWQMAATEEGVRAADEGDLFSHDDVSAWLNSWGSKREKAPPK